MLVTDANNATLLQQRHGGGQCQGKQSKNRACNKFEPQSLSRTPLHRIAPGGSGFGPRIFRPSLWNNTGSALGRG